MEPLEPLLLDETSPSKIISCSGQDYGSVPDPASVTTEDMTAENTVPQLQRSPTGRMVYIHSTMVYTLQWYTLYHGTSQAVGFSEKCICHTLAQVHPAEMAGRHIFLWMDLT